jgi:hypothetical protein
MWPTSLPRLTESRFFYGRMKTMAKKETKEEREARHERMRTAPARQRALADEFHRQKAARDQARRESDSQS